MGIQGLNNLFQAQVYHAVLVILLFIILTNGNFILLELTPALHFTVGPVRVHASIQENQSQVMKMIQMFTAFHPQNVLTKSHTCTE